MAQRKRKLLDSMPSECSASSSVAATASRRANRRSDEESTKRSILEHFPHMTELYMTQHKVDGQSIVERVTQARFDNKKHKGKKLGSAFWLEMRQRYHDADHGIKELQVKDPDQVVSETLLKAIKQARTANCTKRSQAALLSWLQTAETVNQKEFVGIARHAMALRVNSNQAQPRD